jgi:hypothetical protein
LNLESVALFSTSLRNSRPDFSRTSTEISTVFSTESDLGDGEHLASPRQKLASAIDEVNQQDLQHALRRTASPQKSDTLYSVVTHPSAACGDGFLCKPMNGTLCRRLNHGRRKNLSIARNPLSRMAAERITH